MIKPTRSLGHEELLKRVDTALYEARFQGVNEFRGQMNDNQQTFARREQVDAVSSGLSKRLEMIEQRLAGIGGSDQGSKIAIDNTARVISIAVGVIALAISFAAFFLKR